MSENLKIGQLITDHQTRDANGQMWFTRCLPLQEPALHRVASIEYERRRPFSVTTFRQDRDGRERRYEWDFEWSSVYHKLWFDCAGCGGEAAVTLHSVYEPRRPRELWLAPCVRLLKIINKAGDKRPATITDAARLGYKLLRQPRLLTGNDGERTRNPFSAAENCPVYYCRECGEWHPDEFRC